MTLTENIKKGDRVVILGGTGAAKSHLSEAIIEELRMRTRRIVILDSKPRYNPSAPFDSWRKSPEVIPYGQPIKAVEIFDTKQLRKWWPRPENIAVVRRRSEDDEVPYSLGWIANASYDLADGREAWIVVDEGLDFYSINGTPTAAGRPINKISRGGRERGLGLMILSQRSSIINRQTLMDANTMIIGRLDGEDDKDTLHRSYGVPRNIELPEDDAEFILLTKPYKRHKPIRIVLKF